MNNGLNQQQVAACTFISMPDNTIRIIALQRRTSKGFVDLPMEEIESMKRLYREAYDKVHGVTV